MDDYMRLLHEFDDPENYDDSPDFDFEAAVGRVQKFADELSLKLGIRLTVETGAMIQDAIYHSALHLSADRESCRSEIRFSSFGDLATVFWSAHIGQDILAIITVLLEKHEFRYVPEEVLQQPYTGTNPGRGGITDWFERYFGV
jgi:hypothetical protein